MIFGAVPLAEAGGGILAHSIRAPSRLIPKGTSLDDAALAALREAGVAAPVIARLEPDDVPEAEAARCLGDALARQGLRAAPPVHGRVNLFAECPGLLRLDAEAVIGLNLVDEGITLATLPDATPVTSGDMVATLKIIPFAVPGKVIGLALALIQAARLIEVKPFRPRQVGLVLSRLPHLKDATIRHTIEATRSRVAARRGTLLPPVETPHETAPIAEAIEDLRRRGAGLVLIAGASAVTDREDVAPAAIIRAGGALSRFGMPVDPGNLICFGTLPGGAEAIILPGCARSPKLNGIDFVLDRVFAGETLSERLIAGMSIGGLLKDFSRHPEPRMGQPPAQAKPRIAAIVLAAGRSTRAAPAHKLLTVLPDGRSMIAATVDHVLASQAAPVIVVTGHEAEAVRAALVGREVRFVEAPDFASGLAHSLRAGLAALPAEAAGALVCLGDMPLVGPSVLDRLIEAFDPDEGRAIIVPAHRGRRGNPVLWDRRFFSEMAALDGDSGARRLFRLHADEVAEVEVEIDTILLDFDTPDALTALRVGQESIAR